MSLATDSAAAGRQEWLLCPDGLDLREALPVGQAKRLDTARRVVHHITLRSLGRSRADRWTPVSAALGETLAGSRRAWDAVRAALIGAGVLEVDGRDPARGKRGHYLPGVASLRYRLDGRLAAAPLRPEKTKCALREGEIAAAARDVLRRASGRWLPIHDRLEGWLRQFSVDAAAVERVLAGIKDPVKRRHAERIAIALTYGSEFDRAGIVCEYGRFHSIVTRTPRELRSTLRIGGEPLCEIDVSNCQPLVLGLEASAEFERKRSNESEAKAGKQEGERDGEREGLLRRPGPLSLCCTFSHDCVDRSDVSEFVDICSAGRFYEELADVLSMPFRTASQRRAVKLESMRVIFGKHRPTWPRWAAFADRWPGVASHLAGLKRDDHRHAAHVLQRAESRLMIELACGDMMQRHPDIGILTVHDSILTPMGGLVPAFTAVTGAWRGAGAVPKLKVKRPG